jgi:hypothetical protein
MESSNLRSCSIAGPRVAQNTRSKTRPPRLVSPPSFRGNTQSSPCCQLTDKIASLSPGFSSPPRKLGENATNPLPAHRGQSPDDSQGKVVKGLKIRDVVLPHGDGL